jgi:hypothetical protein
LATGLQVLFSQLPYDPGHLPNVPAIKVGKEASFYRTYCEGGWFACPALPSRIAFDPLPADIDYLLSDGPSPLGRTREPKALAAYLDLIQTAEFALPLGSDDYSDPLARKLWSKARLGGQYELKPSGAVVNVLITLKGRTNGYLVDECYLATNQEYREFMSNLNAWQDAIREYFDFYE